MTEFDGEELAAVIFDGRRVIEHPKPCWICSVSVAGRGPLYWFTRWHLRRVTRDVD